MSDDKDPKAPAPANAANDKPAKKGGFPIVLVLIPIALIAALALVFLLPPTHAMLMKSPLGPTIAKLLHTPVTAGGKGEKPVDPVAEVKRLNETVASDKKATAEKDAQIAQLKADASKAAAPPADSSPTPAPKPSPTSVPDDVKRTASVWAAMDADKAAAIINQLPDSYVEAVFGQMPADAVSDIMSELPPKTAARLTAAAPSP